MADHSGEELAAMVEARTAEPHERQGAVPRTKVTTARPEDIHFEPTTEYVVGRGYGLQSEEGWQYVTLTRLAVAGLVQVEPFDSFESFEVDPSLLYEMRVNQ